MALTHPLHTFWYFSKQRPEGSSGVCELLSCKHSKVFVQQRESQLPCTASGCGKMQIAAVHRDRYLQQSPSSCSVSLEGVQASPCAGSLMDTVLVQGADSGYMDRNLCIATAAQVPVGYCNLALQTVRQGPAPLLVLCNKMLLLLCRTPCTHWVHQTGVN